METNINIHTRIATGDDQDFIISLLPRLIEFGPPSWRDIKRNDCNRYTNNS